MKEKMPPRLAGTAIGLAGFVVLCFAGNFGVALGVLLMLWGNNTERANQ